MTPRTKRALLALSFIVGGSAIFAGIQLTRTASLLAEHVPAGVHHPIEIFPDNLGALVGFLQDSAYRTSRFASPTAISPGYSAALFEALMASSPTDMQASTGSVCGRSGPPQMTHVIFTGSMPQLEYPLSVFQLVGEPESSFEGVARELLVTYSSEDGGVTGVTSLVQTNSLGNLLNPAKLLHPASGAYPGAESLPCQPLRKETMAPWMSQLLQLAGTTKLSGKVTLTRESGEDVEFTVVYSNDPSTVAGSNLVAEGTADAMSSLYAELREQARAMGVLPSTDTSIRRSRPQWGPLARDFRFMLFFSDARFDTSGATSGSAAEEVPEVVTLVLTTRGDRATLIFAY